MVSWEVAVVLGHLAINFFWFWNSYKLSDEHYFMKVLMFFLGMITSWITMAQVREVANAQTSTPTRVLEITSIDLQIQQWIFFIIFVYFMLYWVIKWWKKEVLTPAQIKLRGLGVK